MSSIQHTAPHRRDKVDGTFVSAQSHPEVFAKNPGLKNLAAKQGGSVLMDGETLAAFGGAPATPAAPGTLPAPSAASNPAHGTDPTDFVEHHFAAKREAKERIADTTATRRP